jgi:phage tail sheath gpL-like
LVVGAYDPSLSASVTEDVPQLVTSPEDAGSKWGFGFMLQRLIKWVFAGSNGVECWACPQAEDVAAVKATGTITFTGPSTASGTIYLYIAGEQYQISVPNGTSAADICTAVVAAVNAVTDSPVDALVNGAVPEQCDLTAKSGGTWGNEITISINEGFLEELPAGVGTTIVAMASGTTVPDITDALDALGTGDAANEGWFTDCVHGYMEDSTTLDEISTYVGPGNDFLGTYSKTVARPMRWLTGNHEAGSGALTALLALGNGRKQDRANGCVAVPGSSNHPSEIAAVVTGIMARINNDRAAQHYNGIVLPGIRPGELADRWETAYDSRDTATKAGIAVCVVDDGAVKLTDVPSFYHPDSVPISSNAYRLMVNISKIQNILYNIKLNFSQEKWQGIIIVDDTGKVSNATDRQKARDVSSVLDDVLALATSFEGHAWIYTAAFTIERLQSDPSLIQIRPGATGFNITVPAILSGAGGIIDTLVEVDTSLAVLLS